MATIEIKPITQNEKEEILKLARNMVEGYEDRSTAYYNKVMEEMRAGINQRIIDFKSIWFDKELAGYFHLGKKDENTIEVYFLYVYPDFRKKSIGSYILENAVIQAANRNKILHLSVSVKNKYGIKFVSEFGFKQVKSADPDTVLFEVDPRKRPKPSQNL